MDPCGSNAVSQIFTWQKLSSCGSSQSYVNLEQISKSQNKILSLWSLVGGVLAQPNEVPYKNLTIKKVGSLTWERISVSIFSILGYSLDASWKITRQKEVNDLLLYIKLQYATFCQNRSIYLGIFPQELKLSARLFETLLGHYLASEPKLQPQS